MINYKLLINGQFISYIVIEGLTNLHLINIQIMPFMIERISAIVTIMEEREYVTLTYYIDYHKTNKVKLN